MLQDSYGTAGGPVQLTLLLNTEVELVNSNLIQLVTLTDSSS